MKRRTNRGFQGRVKADRSDWTERVKCQRNKKRGMSCDVIMSSRARGCDFAARPRRARREIVAVTRAEPRAASD